ncbi:MAG: ribosome silencing factor [Phycisphaeraceae bacterium]|nr:ribosome silencing factor [Phycisphaeraceae bacterium]
MNQEQNSSAAQPDRRGGTSDSHASEASPRPRTPRHSPEEDAQIQAFALEAARLCHDRHATDIRLLDVQGKSQLCDLMLIATGTSDRQIRSLAAEIEDLAREHNMGKFAGESDPPGKWLVLDFVDVLVHLFEPATRSYYDLEMLWGDGREIPWRRSERADSSTQRGDERT